ncbi:MAG: hypothetical protein PHT89_09495 [Lachnospiraceae bacterium]|nr:hypothetical protein [Lachnospiraceae bacterium]
MKKWFHFLSLILLLSASLFPEIEVHAEGGEWQQVDVKNYDGKEYVDATNANGSYEASSSSAPGSYSYTWKYLGETDTYYDPDILNGETSTSICTFSVPPSSIKGGETITLSLSLQFGAQMLSYYTDAASASADFDAWDSEPGYATDGSIPFVNAEGEDQFKIDSYPTVNILSISEIVTATAPIGTEAGEKIALRTVFSGQKQGTCYIYEWVPDTGAVVSEEETQEPLNTEGIEGIVDIEAERETQEEGTQEVPAEELPEEGLVSQTIESEASENGGEVSAGIMKRIVIGSVLSVVAAAAGAAAAGSAAGAGSVSQGEGGEGEQTHTSSYKMGVYKEFGDKIKKNADPVYVYARIVEVNQEGIEIDRADLTQKIAIFSSDGILSVSQAAIAGEYMGAGVQYFGSEQSTAREAGISFRFSGEGGVFQNNMTFKLVGEPRIELDGAQIFILEGSGRTVDLKYELVDFTVEPEIRVETVHGDAPFLLEIGENKEGERVIHITDKGELPPFETFFKSFLCEIIAENETESVTNRFYVEVCREGILPDFLGKPKEVRGYRVSMESEEMEETLFDVKTGVWLEEKQTLEFVKPEQIQISMTDEKTIFELIGMEICEDSETVFSDRIRYIAKAKTNFPSTQTVLGQMHLLASYGNRSIENEIEISLAPDILDYETSREKEYLACKRVIEIYMAPRFRGKKLYELERMRFQLGLDDLREFRKNCWAIAERSIMQEGQEYLIEAAWYDEAIAYADLAVYIGDIAFDLALAPIGGPIAGFLAAEVKSSIIEIAEIWQSSPEKDFGELAKEFFEKRFLVGLGTADGLIKMPGKDDPKALTIWLACYVIYRIGYHKSFDVDDNNEPIGLIEAVKRGINDFVGKGAGILLGDFIKEQGKGRWVEKISVAEKDEKFVNDHVEKALKKSMDTLDQVADQADEIVSEVLDTLLWYLHKLKMGL